MKKVSVVILNWNGIKYLEKFLPSVTKYSLLDDYEVVVADNASTDDSIDFVKTNYPNIRILVFDQNYGFAEGYNRAIAQIDSEYTILLNSDVEVTENWIYPLIQQMDNDPTIACCMPKIHAIHDRSRFEYAGAAGGFIDKYGYPFCRGRIFGETEMDNGQYDSTIDIFWATGAALFIRTNIYKQIGGLDKDFFAHMEEIDLCWRIKNLGYRIVCVPQSIVYHVGGGALPKENPFKTYLNFRNNLYLLHKNLLTEDYKSMIFKRMLLDGVAGIKFLLSFDFKNFQAIVKAHRDYRHERKSLEQKRISRSITITTPPTEIYPRSIVFAHFAKRIKKYSELKF